MSRTVFGLVTAMAISLSGCANFTGERFDLASGATPRGVYVFDQVPLLVVENGVPRILLVTSADRGTAIRFSAFLAKHDVALEFTDTGTLKKISSNQDSTAALEVLKEIAGKLPTNLGLSGSDGASTLQVYSIQFANGDVVGLRPLLLGEAERLLPIPAPRVSGSSIDEVNDPPMEICDPRTLPAGKTCSDAGK